MEKRSDNQYQIEFRNVSFKYPGSQVYALKNFSMKLKIGEKLAIVGMNGSGKTTMIKLLCRLYDPDEGEILLNGVNIKKFKQEEYNTPFILLDEPTAALDPISEYEIYTQFDQFVGSKTAIYISHRLSSCRFCEKIAVFHEAA